MGQLSLSKKGSEKVVSKARFTSFEEFYKELGTKVREHRMYRIAKIRERKSRDLDQVRCVKDENDNVLVTDDKIRDRWKNYFYKLFNDSAETLNYDIDDLGFNERNINYKGNNNNNNKTRVSEVEIALRKMESGKAVGPMVFLLKFGNV